MSEAGQNNTFEKVPIGGGRRSSKSMKTGQRKQGDLTEHPGLSAVTGAFFCECLEKRSPWLVLTFGAASMLGSGYMFLQHAWILGLIEAVWSVVAFRTWWLANRQQKSARHYL